MLMPNPHSDIGIPNSQIDGRTEAGHVDARAFNAMQFFRELHKDQKRKYTGNPYFDHLAEVAGIAMTVRWGMYSPVSPGIVMAVSYGHDSIEDQNCSKDEVAARFGVEVLEGILWLTDTEVGNRKQRKEQACIRLGQAPGWVQTIKCADLISNTSSIAQHDPEFAKVYLREKRDALEAMTKADRLLWRMAMDCVS